MPSKKPLAMVALLRGINVGGNRKVPMADLRTLATALGFASVSTYIASGNLLFASSGTADDARISLERGIEKQFGFHVDVVVRTAAQWTTYARGSPFPDAEMSRPNILHIALAHGAPKAGTADALNAAAKAGERATVLGDAIWIDYADGVARSKLTPALLDKTAGGPVTARNWRTVLKLEELLVAMGG